METATKILVLSATTQALSETSKPENTFLNAGARITEMTRGKLLLRCKRSKIHKVKKGRIRSGRRGDVRGGPKSEVCFVIVNADPELFRAYRVQIESMLGVSVIRTEVLGYSNQ